MKYSLIFTSAFFSLNLFAAGIQDLNWLAGSWSDSAGTEEHLTSADGGKILGMAKQIVDGKVEFFEFFEINEINGKLVYQPMPMGVAGVDFTATEVTKDRAVFENPTHDFPKKITYELKAADTLSILVEGSTPGGPLCITQSLKKQ